MGDPSRYPEIRMARHMYALQWLPREIRDDRPLLQQWIDNNLTYLDACAIVVFQDGDADFRRDSWSTYHNLHMCRLGVCSHWLIGFGTSTAATGPRTQASRFLKLRSRCWEKSACVSVLGARHPKSQRNTHTALFVFALGLGPRPVLSYTAVGLVPPGALFTTPLSL
eukprot:scaffold4656_cov117-Isochrysis_galbana.AAC.8